MSILNTLRKYLAEYDGLDLVLTDMTRKDASSYAITQAAGGVVTKDILGNFTYQNSYVFLAKEHGKDEADRQGNYDFLESFCEWLEGRNENGDLPELPEPYIPVSLEVSNVMLMDVEDGGAATYQVQLQFTFEKRRNNV